LRSRGQGERLFGPQDFEMAEARRQHQREQDREEQPLDLHHP
jgi:hypothetical protein